ncbi:Phage integrase [Pseudomonas syringae pv. maculicola]|uniref:Phage integrase n=1 Tax=Pseudomonas syringae pv. maculicola TaxID=59511 RepID=A0A0N0G8Q2_PSEYM|nr:MULTISPECIES: site-specific integrase [Pseudomonas syringae group]KPC18236.1 Phage integrase [Pseudomonas syringae pv. maculicola]MBM0209891.1 site-specific integrase [Pseudomonas syringae pv. maculicola]MBV1812505.1 site-specific integrase [Pseudomonas viridiflava]RMM78393.1 Phage integrase [Pseudomonas syringae pv. maculicola]RMV39418.1 Phage integrase [Pseudomonas syringae pv. maculicola]
MTAAVRITDAEIKRQAAGTERDLRDVENRGLYLRFTRDRARASWYLVSKGKWNLVGNFPDLSAKQVVAALPAIRLRLDAGAGSNLSKWVTTGELLDWYADRMSRDRSLSEKRKKTGASLIKCHLKPRLGALPLTGIDKASLDDQFMWPAQETIGIDYVRSAFQLLALAFRQAFKLRLIAANPMKDIKFSDFSKAKVGIKPSRLRGTQLQDLIARLLTVLDTDPAEGLLALMMLCHGTRIGETRQARWAHISLAEREWFIPAENTKTGVEHHLPLTEQVRRILISYRDIQWASGYSGQFLFPSRSGKALSEGQASAVFARLGQGEWTSHDLRKVARTGWADIGIDHLIGELLINHAMGHNVKVYIQSDVMSRKRDALEKWHAHLDSKGLNQIQTLTGFRSGDFGNGLQATEQKGSDPIQESTIGEV